MTSGRWAAVITLLVAGLLVLAFLSTHHREEVDEYVGYQGRAKTDPYFAASLLLEKLGARTGRLRALDPDEHLKATVILFELSARERRAMSGPLMSWVRGGGHLVLAPAEDGEDVLLTELGISRATLQKTGPGKVWVDEHREFDVELEHLQALEIEEAELDPDSEWVVLHKSKELEGVVQLELAVGDGWVTVLASAEPFTNARIGTRQHASWFVDSALWKTREPNVLFLREATQASWASRLWNKAWAFLISGGILLLAWLWKAGQRWGPLLPDPVPESRRILEHVEASGRYLWRRKRQMTLIKALREDVQRRMGPAPTESLPPNMVRALQGAVPSDKAVFTQLVQDLQALRRAR